MIFEGYQPNDAFYDELFSPDGSIREGCKGLVTSLQNIGHPEMMRRWIQAQEEMLATGIAYNLYDESVGLFRPWELDLVPQLIGHKEWEFLSSGLKQRAALLNRVLADLYGPQKSLTDRLIPSNWLFSHPAFRRVFHGQQLTNDTYLHFYAADLARAPDGKWWVVADRTDAPLGIGFALENRIVTSRMLPKAISKFKVERLAPFFLSMQQALRELSPGHRENPRIVLLSHGPKGPNYFEDAYLARYLGYTLVEGADLAVRDDRVYMKTLGGLHPVDVVLRRLSDVYCDPLETRGDSRFGVPGLIQAARLGNVAIANAVGSSLVESPSLMPFLPAICQAWMDQPLQIPSVATWWFGHPDHAETAALRMNQDPNRDNILSAFRLGRMEASSSNASFAEMDAARKIRPQEFLLREKVSRSTAPAWCTGDSEKWHVALRCFVIAKDGTYHVMPGGLVRLAKDCESLDATILGGQLCRDTWVQSQGPVERVSLLSTPNDRVEIRRSGAELPSRVADNLFWFGRNMERAQSACRLIRPFLSRLTGEDEFEQTPDFLYLFRCINACGLAEEAADPDWQKVAESWPAHVLSESNVHSLRSIVNAAHHNASLVRDRLSIDTWRIVHMLERLVAQISVETNEPPVDASGGQFGLAEFDELLDEMIVRLAAMDGLIAESMTRTPAFRFLDLGRRLERTLHNVTLVQSLPENEVHSQVLESMLEVADGLMTYRGRYMAAVDRGAALDLLLTDETNPRSLIFQLSSIADHISNLPHGEKQPLGTPEERIAASLYHSAKMLTVDELNMQNIQRNKLGRFLHRVTEQLPKLSDLITRRYLIHAGMPQQMADGWKKAR